MKTTYKTHEENENRKNDFQLFLNQCKRAVNKVYEYNVSTKYDVWSVAEDGETLWNKLRNTGKLEYTDGFVVLDFIYGTHIYAEMK